LKKKIFVRKDRKVMQAVTFQC